MKTDQEVLDEQVAAHPECPTCREFARTGAWLSPRHTASANCKSGAYPHCTCDTCF